MRKKQALPGNNSFLRFLVSQTQLVKERFSAGLRNFIHICFKKKLHENFAPPETTRQADAGAVWPAAAAATAFVVVVPAFYCSFFASQVIAAAGTAEPYTRFKCQIYVLRKEEGGRHSAF